MSGFVQERKLPVIETVSEVLRGSYAHFVDLVKAAWFPLVLLSALELGVVPWDTNERGASVGGLTGISISGGIGWVSLICQALLYVMIAVVWHRRVLLGESPSGSIYFKFGRREIHFVLYALLIGLFAVVIFGGVYGLGIWRTGGRAFGSIWVVFLGCGLFTFVYLRSTLVFPAVALSQSEPWKTSWAITRGNCWRLFWGFFLIGVVTTIVVSILWFIAGLVSGNDLSVQQYSSMSAINSNVATLALYGAISVISSVYFMMVGVTFLSVSYRYLAGGEDTQSDAEAVFGDADSGDTGGNSGN
ncbi:MAG: hypothetical protein JKY34_00400 [Kordiimonadaceae bacterium]|nr:hypothetical protein [Kordiimonadaceae bacterium]